MKCVTQAEKLKMSTILTTDVNSGGVCDQSLESTIIFLFFFFFQYNLKIYVLFIYLAALALSCITLDL